MPRLAPIHLLGIAISITLLYQSVQLIQKRKESLFEFLLWSGFGVALLVLSLSSAVTIVGILDAIQYLLVLLGFNSGKDGIFVLAILSLLLMLFYTYVNAKTNRKLVYDLNKEIALLRYELKGENTDEVQNEESHHDSKK